MRSARRPLALALLSLLLVGSSACTGANAPVPIQKPQRAAVSASPQATPTALAFNGADADPVLKLATPGRRAQEVSNRLPSDGQQVVLVDSTGGEGVWLRDAPAGAPIKVWPEGAPMLVIGDDAFADDRTWRHVQTLNGQSGWVAADFLVGADPAALEAAVNGAAEAAERPAATAGNPAETRTRAVGDPNAVAAAPTATPRTIARAASNPPAANAVPPAGAPAPAQSAAPTDGPTPVPSATPIRAPSGATSIDAGQTTLAVAESRRSVPIQIGSRPRDGMEMVSVQIKVTNHDDAPFALYRGAFRLALSDRTRSEPLAGGPAPIPYSATVEPGGTVEGSLTFEVPSGTRIDGLIWAPERDVAYSLGI